ncbi:FlgN protein [Fontimonas thermophila]|uniref:FlgN protein n=1 Tax=Fontimonas thermophila TaxID=1076937 RepID=A0A1I2JKF5_9GAMM|nr:flagellar protein FlgN [Fontimonas thermophila]SFF55375.1 FlgN protein [Fontimonas thermophila]
MNTQPDPHADLPQRLADNLAAHLDCTRLLHATLAHEREALLANDVEALERLTCTKTAAAERLAELGYALNRLRRQAGAERIEAWIERADPSGHCACRWRELIALAAQCHDANRANAALLDARSQQIRSALHVVHGSASTPTYARSGSVAAPLGSRPLGLA